MFGKLLIYVLFVVALGSTGAYFWAAKNEKEKYLAVGRNLYFYLTGGIIAASMFLFYNILIHNFQYTYIWSYSSTNLPLHLLISSFYAGQEGSFLLWTLLLAIMGVFLMPYSRKHGYESLVMGIYSLIIVFLLLILIVKSPFNMIWETFRDQNLKVGFTPPEGRGLNPILQNYWIAIHPPILFIGYAAMTVPFIFAIAGMLRKEYHKWIEIALPWTLFAAGILGLGIMMGGFWSYETLGWGGFWGWDPVENASLHPWLIAVALVHTMLVQKNTGGLVKTNLALAIIGFVLVLFATYLTRSGVLGDASVHSFVDPGQIVNFLLLFLLLFFTVSGFVILFFRMKDMPKTQTGFQFSSKEMWLSLGSILIIGLTVLIIYGTTRPILPSFLVSTKAALSPKQYDQFSTPIVLFILLLNAVSIFLVWKKSKWKNVFKKISIHLILSIIAAVVSYFMGIRSIPYLLLGWSAWFSLFINIDLLVRNIFKNPKITGTFIAHLGLSALILGAIASGTYSETKPLALRMGQTVINDDYQYSLIKKNQIEKNFKDREKYEYVIKIDDGKGSVDYVSPVVYWSDFNNYETPYFEPGIKRYFLKDLYISPKNWDFEKMEPAPVLVKGQSVKVSFDTNIVVKFLTFNMSHSHQASGVSKPQKFGVIVSYNMYDNIRLDTLEMEMDMKENKMNPIPRPIPGTDLQIMVTGFTPKKEMSQTEIELMIFKEVFYVDATFKPFINLVWLGVIAIVLGFFIPIFRYRSKNKAGKYTNSETEETINGKNNSSIS